MAEKQYQIPEDKLHCGMAAEPAVATRRTTEPDLQTLRHNIMDAVYQSQDTRKLYSCWEILTDSADTTPSEDTDEWGNRILSKEEGEQLVRDTLLPAYRDVLEAEKRGERLPDISELFKELEERKEEAKWA